MRSVLILEASIPAEPSPWPPVQDNLVSTATVFCLMGSSWPQALTLANTCFDAVDQRGCQIDDHPKPAAPGAETFLQHLHHAGPAAVISNDTRAGIEQFLAHHKLGAGCSSTSGVQMTIRANPIHRPFSSSARASGCHPERVP